MAFLHVLSMQAIYSIRWGEHHNPIHHKALQVSVRSLNSPQLAKLIDCPETACLETRE